jgi:hypothetical protein
MTMEVRPTWWSSKPASGARSSVHHPVFNSSIGKRVIIVKVHPDPPGAHDDRPIMRTRPIAPAGAW